MGRSLVYICWVISFIVFLAISVAFELHQVGQPPEVPSVFMQVAPFIFGILIAFSIANRHSRISSIRRELRRQDAVLLNIYSLSKTFGSAVSSEIHRKIDALLMIQLDYDIVDFDKVVPKLLELRSVILKIKPDPLRDHIFEKMVDNADSLTEIQKEVSYQAKSRMLFYEWITLIVLAGVIITSLYGDHGFVPLSFILVPFISSSLVLLFAILYELDVLKWQERQWIWEPLTELFEELDLLPYYPEAIFNGDRMKIHELGAERFRIAHYPNPYPDISGKSVEVVTIGGRSKRKKN
jgi:hypothetical protein